MFDLDSIHEAGRRILMPLQMVDLDSYSSEESNTDISVVLPENIDDSTNNLPIATHYTGENQEENDSIIEGVVVTPNTEKSNNPSLLFLLFMIVISVAVIALVTSRKEAPYQDIATLADFPILSPTMSQHPTSYNAGYLKEMFAPVSGEEVLDDPNSVQHFVWKELLSPHLDTYIRDNAISLNDTEDLIQRYVMTVVHLSTIQNLDPLKPTLAAIDDFPHVCIVFPCNEEKKITVVESRFEWSAGQGGGIIASEIGELKSLTHLVINGNRARGTIPTEVGMLQELQYLDLMDNLFTGTIPSEIGKLENLRVLHLRSNMFSGSIPLEIANLKDLIFLDVSDNMLTGTISSTFNNLKSLEVLALNNNSLIGPVNFFCDRHFASNGTFFVEMDIGSSNPYEISGMLGLSLDCERMNECSCCRCN